MEDKNVSIYYGQDEGSIYTKEGKERLLKEENVIFLDGSHATKIIPRENMNPLIQLLGEDDEKIFSRNRNTFDAYWIDDMINVLKATKKEVKRQGLMVYKG